MVNHTKEQGPGFSVKFLSVMWEGKTKVMPEAIVEEYRLFPSLHLFPSYNIFGASWAVRDFIPHLAQIIRPLYRRVKKAVPWGWETQHTEAVIAAKWTVKQAQA